MKPRYLGDGVYASFDGYQIWLKAERDGSMHEIAIEPEVLARLLQYNRDLDEFKAAFRRGQAE
jgi:hypothetical protein